MPARKLKVLFEASDHDSSLRVRIVEDGRGRQYWQVRAQDWEWRDHKPLEGMEIVMLAGLIAAQARIAELETPNIFWDADDPEWSLMAESDLEAAREVMENRVSSMAAVQRAHLLPNRYFMVPLDEDGAWDALDDDPVEITKEQYGSPDSEATSA